VLFDKIASVYLKNIYISALEMASPGNQHCANCIGTLSFPIRIVFMTDKSGVRIVRRLSPRPHASRRRQLQQPQAEDNDSTHHQFVINPLPR